MAITVTIENSSVGIDETNNENRIFLAISSENTDRAGEKATMSMSFPVSVQALQMKSEINDAATLLWQSSDSKTWTV